jgi:hypothetical protein
MHLGKYGPFGLSLSKPLLVKYGARPVLYIPVSATDKGSSFGEERLRNIEQVYRGFHKHLVVKLPKTCSRMHVIGSEPKICPNAAYASRTRFRMQR